MATHYEGLTSEGRPSAMVILWVDEKIAMGETYGADWSKTYTIVKEMIGPLLTETPVGDYLSHLAIVEVAGDAERLEFTATAVAGDL